MLFNSGTNSIVDDIRYLTRTNATTYPLADIVRNANAALDYIVAVIKRFDTLWTWEDANNTTIPIGTANLVSGQSEYSLAATAYLKVRRVRVQDQNGNWITLDPKDRRQLSDDDLAQTGTPFSYDIIGSYIILNPSPNYGVTAGLEIEAEQGVGNYFQTSGTDALEPGFPAPFHRLVSLLAGLDYRDLSEKDRTNIEEKLGTIPDDNTTGSGLWRELAQFFADRDKDAEPRMAVKRTLERF